MQNTNFLSRVNFRTLLHRAPNFNFFAQTCNIPGLSLPRADVPTPFVNLPQHGDKIAHEDLTITFKVDENLKNYLELQTWIRGAGFPESFEDHANYIAGQPIYSDISIILYNSAVQPHITFTFKDCWPTALSPLPLSTIESNVDPIDMSVSFAFSDFTIKSLIS